VTDELDLRTIESGRRQAERVLEYRKQALELRERALRDHLETFGPTVAFGPLTFAPSAGLLVAEGDSWFDYPFHDVLERLEDLHAYDVESVAHKGDPIEDMAYGGGQLEEFTRLLEKLLRRGQKPKAILLSGGGNDVAGKEFGMLLNHADSSIAGLNAQVADGVIGQRVRTAYVTILAAVTRVCDEKLGHVLPILVHGYDYPVPDGRGFLGGWWFFPGPWLEPGFREKGYGDVASRLPIMRDLIDRFNAMLAGVVALPAFAHVHYIDLRNTLSNGADYRDWWANELHPTANGFEAVTRRFADVLRTLP
jgi:GDSL-like Lipase/Acylhydrolase family